MKHVLPALILLLVATPVAAQTVGPEVTVTAVSQYVFGEQAFIASTKPAINASLDVGRVGCFRPNVWAQYGSDQISQEIDLTATCPFKVGAVDMSFTAGGYFSPAYEPIYTVMGTASVPLNDNVSLNLKLQRYGGSFESTLASAAVSGNVGPAKLSLGRAQNTGDINPWFASASVPVGDSGFNVGVDTFWGEGSATVFKVSRTLRF